jgi:hypothetical protein
MAIKNMTSNSSVFEIETVSSFVIRTKQSVARAVGSVVRCTKRRNAIQRYASTSNAGSRNGSVQKSGWSNEKKREFEDAIENYESSSESDAEPCKVLSNGKRTRAQKICKKIRDTKVALKMKLRSRFAEGKSNAGDMGGIVLGGLAIVVVTAVLL